MIDPQTRIMIQLKIRQDLGNYSNPVATVTQIESCSWQTDQPKY